MFRKQSPFPPPGVDVMSGCPCNIIIASKQKKKLWALLNYDSQMLNELRSETTVQAFFNLCDGCVPKESHGE
jgi:hypothetical protein